MSNIVELQQQDYASLEDPTHFDVAQLERDRAERNLALLDDRQQIVARCSLWWSESPDLDGEATGAIGHYAASTGEAGKQLLRHACRELRQAGCSYAVGPMDGNTWRRYRFVTERGHAAPFFLEPDNPVAWPGQFTDLGFDPIAHYESELNPDIANRQPELGPLHSRMQQQGISIDAVYGTADIHGIYDVVCEAFLDSFLYTKLDRDSFCSMYHPFVRKVDPGLMLVARHAGRVAGFIFGPPDYLDPDTDTIVIKTVAILPRERYRGLGRLLIVELLNNALALGYTKAISALMYAGKRSQQISSDCAGPMRGYTLFGRRLVS